MCVWCMQPGFIFEQKSRRRSAAIRPSASHRAGAALVADRAGPAGQRLQALHSFGRGAGIPANNPPPGEALRAECSSTRAR